jgi:hypothetical protein
MSDEASNIAFQKEEEKMYPTLTYLLVCTCLKGSKKKSKPTENRVESDANSEADPSISWNKLPRGFERTFRECEMQGAGGLKLERRSPRYRTRGEAEGLPGAEREAAGVEGEEGVGRRRRARVVWPSAPAASVRGHDFFSCCFSSSERGAQRSSG